MSAIKNGIKELHCKESLSGKRFKRSIAHNNLKSTCNIYHIQVFKLPFPLDRSIRSTRQNSGDSLLQSSPQCPINMLKKCCTAKSPCSGLLVFFCLSYCVLRFICLFVSFFVFASCRDVRMGEAGAQDAGGGGWGGGFKESEARVALGLSLT